MTNTCGDYVDDHGSQEEPSMVVFASMLAQSRNIQDEEDMMELDEKWDELLASPESVADMEEMAAKIQASRKAGTSIRYVPGKSLAELFSPRV